MLKRQRGHGIYSERETGTKKNDEETDDGYKRKGNGEPAYRSSVCIKKIRKIFSG